MNIIACGLNHKTTPLALREQVALLPQFSKQSLQELTHNTVQEAAILSTCNRTELYCRGGNEGVVIDWWQAKLRLKSNELQSYLYCYQDIEAVRHILRVASGLDSMILGEPQILGQMKLAYSDAVQIGAIGNGLNRLFQYVFAVTKRIRSETGIGTHPVSLALAAVNLIKHIFTELKSSSALLIGAGETIELSARYLSQGKLRKLFFANRTLDKAQSLANTYNGQALQLHDIPYYLKEVDIVISATLSPLPLLGKGMIEQALKMRKHRPMVLIDLAVPRDIEPEVSQLADVYLYNVDDLQEIVAQNWQHRQQAALQAEQIIEVQSEHFMRWLRSLNAVTSICAYRSQAEAMRDSEVEKALKDLQRGENAQTVVKRLALGLTNKLIHHPTINLREAGYHGRLELLDAAQHLLNLKDKK